MSLPLTDTVLPMKEHDELIDQLNAVKAWITSRDDALTFPADAAAHPAGTDLVIAIQVQDVDNILNPLTGVGEVTVDIDGGTATVKQLFDPTPGFNGQLRPVGVVDASMVFPVLNGVATVGIRSSAVAAETVILGLTDSGASGLDITDTHTTTYA